MLRTIITSLILLISTTKSVAQCDSLEHIMGGKLTTGLVKSVKIKLDSQSEIPKKGQRGELSKYFESNLFGFTSSGWLVIAIIEIGAYSESTHTLSVKVLEEQSSIPVNGERKNHFAKGNIVKFNWKTKPVKEPYYKIVDRDTLVIGMLLCGQRQGIWEYYYKTGQLQERDTYTDDKSDGNYIAYHENGVVAEEGNYIMGKRNGVLKLYYSSGKMKKIINYEDNMKNGQYQKFYKEGGLEYEVTYENDHMNGPFKNYYFNGNVKEEGVFKNGLITGILKGYYESGQLYFVSGFESDRRQGAYVKYFESGKKHQEGVYKNGKLEGYFSAYFESGETAYKCSFKANVKDGAYVSYFKNGQIKQKGIYNNGTKIGFWEEYYESGKPKTHGSFDDRGQKIRKWISWNEKGKKTKTKY